MSPQRSAGEGPALARSTFNPKPQELLFSFLGALVFEAHDTPLPSHVYLRVLADLGVSEAAARATLKRLTHRKLLDRDQVGRIATFGLNESSRALLEDGRQRIRAAEPFARPGEGWTLLSFSIPEGRRELRHQLRSRLIWAGFGALRDGLWIAPGSVDLSAALDGIAADGPVTIDSFTAEPTGQTRDFVARVWDLDAVRNEHQAFLDAWRKPERRDAGPIAELSMLTAHWVHVLRADPALPRDYLPPDWPSAESARTYRAVSDRLGPAAGRAFEELIDEAWARR